MIEAGFPITSPGDFEAVQAIARRLRVEVPPIIAGLARTHVADIDAAWNAVKDAERPRIHTFISTSDIHISHQLQTTREDVKGQARAAVAHAKQYVDDVEFSPMDATRAELEFTAEVCQIAIDEGATTINIPDTVGYALPLRVRRVPASGCTSWCPTCATWCCRSTATMIWGWPWPTRSPGCWPARARSSARSTASASGPAMPRWRRS